MNSFYCGVPYQMKFILTHCATPFMFYSQYNCTWINQSQCHGSVFNTNTIKDLCADINDVKNGDKNEVTRGMSKIHYR